MFDSRAQDYYVSETLWRFSFSSHLYIFILYLHCFYVFFLGTSQHERLFVLYILGKWFVSTKRVQVLKAIVCFTIELRLCNNFRLLFIRSSHRSSRSLHAGSR